MSGKVRHLLNRDGRYYARLVIPDNLRQFLDGKTELRTPLGADRRTALAKLPSAVAALQHKIALAEQRSGRPVELGRYPLSEAQIALRHYSERLAFDEAARNAGHQWSNVGVDDYSIALLKDGIAGNLRDDELEILVGSRIERYRRLGNTTVEKGTPNWRTLARGLCVAELEAMGRVIERDEGDYTGKPEHPLLANAKPIEEEKPPVSIKGLFKLYMQELKANDKGVGAEKRWTNIIDDLVQFVRSDDANKLTKKKLIEWKDAKLASKLAPRTVKDVYLTAIKAVLNWAVSNDHLEANPAQNIKMRVAAKALNRSKGFTNDEAKGILKFSLAYVAPHSHNPRTRELRETSAAKKWAPLLCTLTGSRIAEITQLRKEDFRYEKDVPVMRITPDAGSVKNRQYRDVPLHKQIVELGFLEFVNAAPDGPLFYPKTNRRPTARPAQTVAGRVSEWLQNAGVIPEGVSPNHGWRHSFKTIGREAEIDTRILDAIQGHAPRTAGDDYGDVTIAAKKKALDRIPGFELKIKNVT